MADSLYMPKVYNRQGGEALVVGNGGSIVMQTGAKLLPNSETQAAHIPNATGGVTISAAGTAQAKINAILVALRGIGALATS